MTVAGKSSGEYVNTQRSRVCFFFFLARYSVIKRERRVRDSINEVSVHLVKFNPVVHMYAWV